jgi:hypothetical protein
MSVSGQDSESIEMNRIYNECVLALGILFEAAEQGSSGAAECLRDISDRLRVRAAIWGKCEEGIFMGFTRKLFFAAFCAVLTFAVSYASKKIEVVPRGSRVFIATMEGNLHGFIAAEIIKKKLPVTVVVEEKDAEFVLSGASIQADSHWYNVVFGGKDKNEGNVRLLSVKDKTMVWAGEAGDRSLWWGSLKRGGERKVADRIVRKMKSDLW